MQKRKKIKFRYSMTKDKNHIKVEYIYKNKIYTFHTLSSYIKICNETKKQDSSLIKKLINKKIK